jgi:Leishmanolysin
VKPWLWLSCLVALTACPNTGVNPPAPPPPPGATGYQVTVLYDSSVDAKYKPVFEAAATRWGQIVTGDQTDVANVDTSSACAPEVSIPGTVNVDDVVVLVGTFSEGVDGTLGFAGPCGARFSNGLTIIGLMKFDTFDLDALLAEGLLDETITHEMGHVLGIGTLWDRKNLTSGISNQEGVCGTNPRYIGPKGIAEYKALGGPEANVPLEDKFGPGSCEGHWRESVFKKERMTSFLNAGANPLSRLTIASMEDLGYTVSYNTAEAFALNLLPDLSPQNTSSHDHPHSTLLEPRVVIDDR